MLNSLIMVDVKSFLSFTLDDVEEYAQSLNCPERLGVGPSIVLPNGDVYDLTSVNLDGDATHFTFFHLIFDSLAQDLRDEYPDDEDIDYEIYELDDDRRIMDYVESDLGIVTLNEGRTYVEPHAKLVALKKPTDAQYEVIEEYLDEVQKYKSVVFCFLTEKSDYVSYRFDENTTDEIIEKIKRTFAFGRVFEDANDKNITESSKESTRDKTGREYNIWTECTGGYSGQSDYMKIAYVGDNWMDEHDRIIRENILGYLQYAVADDEEDTAYIQMIEVKESERRKGIATALVDSLKKEYKEINWGYTTNDGTKFYNSYSKINESRDTEFTFTEEDIKKAAEGREGFGEALSIVTTDGQAYNIDEWETHPNFFTGIVFDEDSEIDELDCADYAIDDLGVITLNSGGYYEERCKIVIGRKPTEAQYRTIENWLETLYDDEVAVVTVYIGYNHADFDLSEYTAQDVIKSIKRFFVTGMFEALNEKIVKKGTKWQVQSEKGRNMGTFDTKAEAEKRLKQVHYFKHLQEYIETNEFELGAAGYVKEDGSLIILDEYHGEDAELQKMGYPEFSNTHSEDDTCIRLYKEPNPQQYATLEKIIDAYLDAEDYCKVEIWKNNKPDFYKIFTLYEDACSDRHWDEEVGNWTGYDLIRKIKQYFKTPTDLTEKIIKKDNKEDYQKKFDERTHAHIDRVNKYAKKINKEYPHHDEDKFNELYAGYSLMSKNKEDITKEEQAMIDDATFKHVINNEHHCEHWVDPKDIEGFSRNNPTPNGCLDCSKMPESALEEMCCDWCAMSEEFNNTPFEWYEKNKDVRWHFNEEQDKFILDTLHKLWDTEKMTEDLQETDNDEDVDFEYVDMNEGSSGVPNKQKYQNKKLKKNIVKIAKECGFNGIIDTKELSMHHLSDVYENGLKDNSYKNIWFIKSKDWKDRELLHKLLHYMDRNEVSYQELLDKLEEIKLYQYDDVNNRFVEKTLSTFRESLTESKQDDENFKKWLNNVYEEVGYQWSSPEIDVSDYMSNADACYSLFQSYRKDNSGKETDYYYWMKRDPSEFFYFLARYAEKSKERKELIDKENSGAERIAETDVWYVYKITSYEASRKYGRNTTWCITDEYDWDSYRDDWGIDYFLFFIPKDDSKYMRHAVGVSDNEVQMIFNQEDCKVEGIPNVPHLPSDYPQIEDAMNKDFYSYFDVSDDITEANLRDATEAGVNWLDYLWFLRNDEDEIKGILQNDFHIDMNESLTEAKADTERFLKWISDGYRSMKYSDWASGVYAKEAVDVFNKYKNSLKGEQRDIYAWMKKPFSDFASLISSLKKKDDEKAEATRKEDEGSELVYENDDWLVYEITNYEASVKYGKGTKWCISGSKRWENGKNGREHWDGYHESGIIFYFFINRKNGRKYALAIYPDMEHYEIFNDADIAISYIPDAPFVKQVAGLIDGKEHEPWYAEVNPKHEIQTLIAEGKVDFNFIKQYLNDCVYNYREGTLILYNDVDDFVKDLDWSIPDEYLEWEAVTDGKMSVEQYKKLTGYDYAEEWVGDVPQISNWDELKNWEKGKEAALDKSNFDSGFYLIANEDDGEELWSYHKDFPDALLEFSRYSPDILNEITQRIFTDLESGSITVKDVFNAFDLSEDTKDNLKQMYESLSHSSSVHAIINEKTGMKMSKKELRKQIDVLSENELNERIAQLESDAKKLFEAKSGPNPNDAFLLSYAKMVKARDYACESLKEEKESVDSIVLDDEYLSFDEFLDRAEVIVVDDAKTFDINEYEANLMSEIEEELCEEQDVDIKSAFTKYRLDDERLKKVIEKLSKSEFNIVDYWKTKQFMKKNGLTKEDLSFVLRNLKDEDYKTNSISKDDKHNEAMIFVKDSSVGNLGPFSLYIKLDYDSVEENPVIVISFHQRKGSKKKTDSESIVSGLEEDIEKHDELNQKLFDGDELRQDVKDKVVEIANAFVDELKTDGITFNLKDIVLIGSNVNYNYTKDSDLDIHLIADSEGLECPDELYPLLYSAYRSIFNKNYGITIKGIPAEIYVEMDEPQGVSNGIYSIENGWVKKPVQTDIPDIDREKLDDELSKWEDKYFELRDKIEYALASTEHPLDESFKVRNLSEEYVDDDKEIFTTESPYEVANMLRSSEKALRILYDRKLKRFFVCDADELIHREMVDAAWERGYYAQLVQSGVLRGKWELDSYLDDYGGHVIYYIYAPLDKVADTYGSEVNEDGYEGKYVYDFGVVTTRSDDKYKSSPLGKALGKYEHHYVQDGWIDDYTPKIIEVA